MAVPAPRSMALAAQIQNPVVAPISAMATAWVSMPAISHLRPIRSDRAPVTSWPRPPHRG